MDTILIIKSVFIGLIWAGSFYLVLSYILPIVPMPQLFTFRNYLRKNSDNLAMRNEAKGLKRWNFFKKIFKIITFLLWFGLMAAFAYLLIAVLGSYIPQTHELFWVYYGIAIALPGLIILVRGINIYRNASKKTALIDPEPDDRPLLEQMSN
jgi:hypothetical protein